MAANCTASSKQRTVPRDQWVKGEGPCPDCGAHVEFWVRATDLSPRCKVKAHRAPAGVVPAPYAAANS